MKPGVDIYVYGLVDDLVIGIHSSHESADLKVGDTFTVCYDTKKRTPEELMNEAPPDRTPLNARSIHLTIVKMEERMGGHTKWLDSLSSSSGRYAGLHLVGTGRELIKKGMYLRTGDLTVNA